MQAARVWFLIKPLVPDDWTEKLQILEFSTWFSEFVDEVMIEYDSEELGLYFHDTVLYSTYLNPNE